MERRDIIKQLTVLPFAGSLLSMESVLSAPRGPLVPGQNIYQSIGVEPIINCVGTYTIIGGSIERPEVVTAMHDASGYFVQYDELAVGIGQRLADLTGAEWGVVTSGCAGAENTFTIACVTGGNPEKLLRIPDLTGFDKTEVVIPRKYRNASDHAIVNVGVKIIDNVDTTEEIGRALNPKTAMIYLFAREPDLPKIAEMAKPLNIPILVDAAAEDLTIPNVHLQRGATAVCYSGGKAICGPQCAGLLLGRKDLLLSAWQAGSPHWGPGRTNKVGKEEMIGMLAAVEAWIARDHVEKMNTWLSYLDTISKRISPINGVTCTIQKPTGLGNASPSLTISWDPEKFNIGGPEVAEELANKQPRIAVSSRSAAGTTNTSQSTSISVKSGQMQPGNDKVVANRIFEELTQKRTKKEMVPPVANITGRWDVEVEYYASKSKHTITIEQQDGNWLQGSHKRDFCIRDIVGILEGDQIKLSSEDRETLVAHSLPMLFSGTLSGDKMSGKIVMFGYLNAKFTATRHNQNEVPRQILIPKNEPLAT